MAKKVIRKSIRIGGKTVNSPRFTGRDAKKQALEWYSEKLKEKDFIEKGLLSSNVPTFMTYSAKWIRQRINSNPKSTWYSDEQRLRKYLLPYLSEFPMDRITRVQMREVLRLAQVDHRLSIGTRTRIKALASKIFNDAMNENPPLCALNPCSHLSFNDPRQGEKIPATLEDEEEVIAFLKQANETGKVQALACAIAVMAGLRKSEIIPLKYRNVRAKRGSILVDCHVEQASLEIKPGTKAGQGESREVFVSQDLIDLIEAYRREAKFHSDNDFIFTDAKGDWIRPRKFHSLIDVVVQAFGRPITLHKLRHTYGRMFAMKTGNMRALQDLLGHKSAATTAIYSKLSGLQLKQFGEVMSYRKSNEKPSGSPPDRHHSAKQIQTKRGVKDD